MGEISPFRGHCHVHEGGNKRIRVCTGCIKSGKITKA